MAQVIQLVVITCVGNEEVSIVQAAGCPNVRSFGVPSAGVLPARGCCTRQEEGWCLFDPSLSGAGNWVGARECMSHCCLMLC